MLPTDDELDELLCAHWVRLTEGEPPTVLHPLEPGRRIYAVDENPEHLLDIDFLDYRRPHATMRTRPPATPTGERCDCYCSGRCPAPFAPGSGGPLTWQCPRDAAYELTWQMDDDEPEIWSSAMCTECTAERRSAAHPGSGELVSVRSLP